VRILISSIVDLKSSAHNRLHEFIRDLSRNHEVTILSIKDWWKAAQVDAGQYNRGVEDIWPHVSVQYFTTLKISPILQEMLSLFTLGRRLRQLGDFDVHFNYNTLVSGLFLSVMMKRRGVKTVYDLADDLPAMIRTSPQINPVLRPFGGLFASLMLRCNLHIAEKVTLTTEALHLPDRYQEKYIVLPNGVDTSLFSKKDSRDLRRELGIEDCFVMGYVGVLREWVDLRPTLGALAALRDRGHNVKLLILGEEGGLDACRSLTEEFGVADQVLFIGTVPYEQVPRYVSLMNVGLIPFGYNPVASGALPLKLLEYMSCEIPVICTPLPGITTAVGDTVLYAGDADDIVEHVVRIKERPAEMKRMQAEGLALVQKDFEWRDIAHHLGAVLDEVRMGSAANQRQSDKDTQRK
jgi:glycosyltransferase involved in cell wall biosynthesis